MSAAYTVKNVTANQQAVHSENVCTCILLVVLCCIYNELCLFHYTTVYGTRGVQKLHRLTQLITGYVHQIVTFQHSLLQLKCTRSTDSPKLGSHRRIVDLAVQPILQCRKCLHCQQICVLL